MHEKHRPAALLAPSLSILALAFILALTLYTASASAEGTGLRHLAARSAETVLAPAAHPDPSAPCGHEAALAGVVSPERGAAIFGATPFAGATERDAGARGAWWIFFADKGGQGVSIEAALRRAAESLTPRARDRRLRTTGSLALDQRDLPVNPDYLRALRGTGAIVKGTSRWLNAASVRATAAELQSIARMPFVKSIRPVAVFKRDLPEIAGPSTSVGRKPVHGIPAADPAYYNRTYDQLEQINVTGVHDAGYTGTGVLVCMLDTGYNLRHEALIDLDVVAEWDFVQGDSVTSNQEGDYPTQHNHGTMTMSTIGGFKPTEFVGGAPDAQFALAKTEIVDQEIQIEEDNYVMGLEWADSLGADVVSSSLGYLDWYTYEDMDGETAVTTVAVDVAAAKGITVVTAMGNEQSSSWHYLIAPADADTVIAVGAVDSDGVLTSFSSVGPTYDGRIKPDVVALGLYTSAVSPSDSTGYVLASGTSLSTPLIASAAALLVEAHPDWGPVEIRQALRCSGDQAFSPDTARGWGLPDALEALGMPAAAPPGRAVARSALAHPNPFTRRTTLSFSVPRASTGGDGGRTPIRVSVHDAAGRLVRTLFDGKLTPGPHALEWNGRGSDGAPLPPGVYFFEIRHPEGVVGAKALLVR